MVFLRGLLDIAPLDLFSHYSINLVSNTRPTCTGVGAVCWMLPWVVPMPCLSGCVPLCMEYLDVIGLACLVDYTRAFSSY